MSSIPQLLVILAILVVFQGSAASAAHFDDNETKKRDEVSSAPENKKAEKPATPLSLPKTDSKLGFEGFLSRIGGRYCELAEDLLENKSKGAPADILDKVDRERHVVSRLCDKKGRFVGLGEKINQNELDIANVAALSDAVINLENLSRGIERAPSPRIVTLRSQCLDGTQATFRNLKVTDAYGKDREVAKQVIAIEIWGKRLNNWYRSEK